MNIAGVKLTLILSNNLVERLVTMVMAFGILLNVPLPEPTYSQAIGPVNMVTEESLDIHAEIMATNTAGTTNSVKHSKSTVVGTPRLVAQPGESQEVIDAIVNTFPEAPIMVEIARCESGLNPSADRKGIDGGLFQINQVHLPALEQHGLDRYDLQDNLTYSRMLYDSQALSPWYMSEHCWERYL